MKYKELPTHKISGVSSKSKRQVQTIIVQVPDDAERPLLRKPKTNVKFEENINSISDREESKQMPIVFNMDKTILMDRTDTNQKTWDKLSERELKRKQRNRIAAHKAREKIRLKIQKLEAEIGHLKKHTMKLETMNSSLLLENQELMDQIEGMRMKKDSLIIGYNEDTNLDESNEIDEQAYSWDNSISIFPDLFSDMVSF